ncbi:hypothetical protein R1flu_003901 [Riccia fluitans]|uniref:Tyrosine--tRNA ligase n=1 Tax=Riccia fluitans TaxID=41844 RepID=A0ABD1YAC6_9MARC
MMASSHIARGAMVFRLHGFPRPVAYPSSATRSVSFFAKFSSDISVLQNTELLPVFPKSGKDSFEGHGKCLKIFRSKQCRGISASAFSRTRAVSTGAEEILRTRSTSVEEKEGVDLRISCNVIDVLEERGLIESTTGDELRLHCSKPTESPVKVYCGFDPTAESLHLGNLLGIIVLSWFQRCGHVPVALMGGATARVGDPSGKSVERPVLSDETIERNLLGIRKILEDILKVDRGSDRNPGKSGLHSPVIVNNYDWWKSFSLLEFLRDVGKYARVGTMMAKESVKRRLSSEEGMSYTEFTYQLLQGYDFLKLFKEDGISVQIGGSDQWGNITAGTELIRKVLQQDGSHGLTWPLLLKSDGTKFGKSEGGAIWLAASMLSPYKFYQYLFGTADADVIKLLKVLTFLDMEEIQRIESAMGTPGYVPNTAQRKLAEEVTRFVHGEEALADAQKATDALAPGASTKLDAQALEAILQDVPSCSVSRAEVLGTSLVDICVKTELLANDPSLSGEEEQVSRQVAMNDVRCIYWCREFLHKLELGYQKLINLANEPWKL